MATVNCWHADNIPGYVHDQVVATKRSELQSPQELLDASSAHRNGSFYSFWKQIFKKSYGGHWRELETGIYPAITSRALAWSEETVAGGSLVAGHGCER